MSRGFTLLEALIAMAIASLVLAGTLLALAASSRRYHETEQLARLQERAAFAFSVLQPELQMAGYGGLRALRELPRPNAAVLGPEHGCGLLADWPPEPLRIHAGPWALTCAAHGGGAIVDAHAITVLRAAARDAAPEHGRLQVLSSRSPDGPHELLVAGTLPPATTLARGQHELHDLLLSTYYIARNSDGLAAPAQRPALRVKELTSIDGRPAIRDTEVVSGIDDLAVEEGWLDAGGSALHFAAPGLRPADRPIAAVRVKVRLVSDSPAAAAGVTRPGITAERVFALRNARLEAAP